EEREEREGEGGRRRGQREGEGEREEERTEREGGRAHLSERQRCAGLWKREEGLRQPVPGAHRALSQDSRETPLIRHTHTDTHTHTHTHTQYFSLQGNSREHDPAGREGKSFTISTCICTVQCSRYYHMRIMHEVCVCVCVGDCVWCVL